LRKIWSSIDISGDGSIEFKEFANICFPELTEDQVSIKYVQQQVLQNQRRIHAQKLKSDAARNATANGTAATANGAPRKPSNDAGSLPRRLRSPRSLSVKAAGEAAGEAAGKAKDEVAGGSYAYSGLEKRHGGQAEDGVCRGSGGELIGGGAAIAELSDRLAGVERRMDELSGTLAQVVQLLTTQPQQKPSVSPSTWHPLPTRSKPVGARVCPVDGPPPQDSDREESFHERRASNVPTREPPGRAHYGVAGLVRSSERKLLSTPSLTAEQAARERHVHDESGGNLHA